MNNQSLEFLLVEDNDDDILLMEESFFHANITNTLNVVKDGEEALAYLRQKGKYKNVQLPSLVLLDINMPKKGGFEVLHEIKADPVLKAIPVIIMTSSHREEDIIRAYIGGACSYITKPVRFQDFVETVERFYIYWSLVVSLPNIKENG
jgi:CheY-like chemotaxis protein